MAVKILIKRKVPREKGVALLNLITELRGRATVQPGYISGETMRSTEKPDEYLVISTWQSADDWKAWEASEERKTIQSKIDAILGEPTQYEIYDYPEKSPASLRAYKGWEGG
jgi:heme-degrading monooxygenase HmoA